MKATLKIYGNDYEIEIKAKDKRNLNASKKATEKAIKWIECRILEACETYKVEDSPYKIELRENAHTLHKLINKD